MDKRFFVYILTSRPLGPLYIGVTSGSTETEESGASRAFR